MRWYIKYLLFLILFLAKGGGLFAQYSVKDTIPIHEVLVISKLEFGNQTAGGVVQRIDTLEMMHKMTRNISELLAENTPVFIKSNGRGALATASMRGAGASHTAVLWNNIPINSPLTGQVDFSLIPVYFTDALDLYFGSSSLQNTGGALGGSVALNNSPDWNPGFSANLMQSFGQFGTYGTFGNINLTMGSWNLRSRVFYEFSANNFSYFVPGNRDNEISGYQQLQHAEYEKSGNLTELNYRVNNHTMAGAKLWYQTSDRNIPALIGSSVYYHDENQKDRNLKTLAFFKNYGSQFSWEIQSAFIADNLDYVLRNQPNDTADVFTHYQSENSTQSSITRFQGTYKMNHDWKLEMQLQTKLDWAHVMDLKIQQGFDPKQNTLSAMLALHKIWGERWYFSGLLRQQWVDGTRIMPMPTFGLEYLLSKKMGIKVKGNLSKNYHYPSLNDLYYVPGGNPELLPEESLTFEASINQELKKERFEFDQSLNSYWSHINNWIQWTPSPYGYWTPANLYRVYAKGLEYSTTFGYRWEQLKTRMRFQYAYSPTTNESDPENAFDASKGQQLIYIPQNAGSASLFVDYNRVNFNWLTSYLGRRQTATVANSEFFIQQAYWLTNVSAGCDFSIQKTDLSIRLQVENLFNVSYQNITDRPMPLRNYSLLLKIALK